MISKILAKIFGTKTEREVKRAQMTLMIRIKNKLSPEQQARLRAMRHEISPSPKPPGQIF